MINIVETYLVHVKSLWMFVNFTIYENRNRMALFGFLSHKNQFHIQW